MVQVLVIGYAPDAVDFTDPAIPPGMNATIVAKALEKALQLMRERGWQAEHLFIRPEEGLRRGVESHLANHAYDVIVIGAGVRLTTKHVVEFEQVVDAVRRAAPQTPIAFNSGPDASGEAAARWVQ